MSDATFDLSDIEKRMKGALASLKNDFSGLRTGRASASLLDPVNVMAYGSPMPLSQVATVSVPEPRTISVNVWDQSQVAAVEKAIRESGLGLNPNVEGSTLRINIPELNEERRAELTKVAAKYAEQARVAVRNVRRDGMDILKKQEKDGDIGQDEQHTLGAKVDDLTKKLVDEIDSTLATKEAEIMQV
ncbi:MAG: ribosome recycling factor [Rhizobiales bacterium]|nr:ribosome recycling factor [Hyphomicrobiales bacterium]